MMNGQFLDHFSLTKNCPVTTPFIGSITLDFTVFLFSLLTLFLQSFPQLAVSRCERVNCLLVLLHWL